MPSVATAEEQKFTYLPPLDQCFADTAEVIPWTNVVDALVDTAQACHSSSLRTLLEDDLNFQALSNCTRSAKPPNGQAKSDFETRTAAINVSLSQGTGYNVDQIKNDALWLAKQAKIDELTALRTAVLEWQDRPKSRILGTYSEEESLSVQDIVKPSYGGRSESVLASTTNGMGKKGHSSADESARRAAILQTWYKEQQSMLMVRALLARNPVSNEDSDRMITSNGDGVLPAQWLIDLDTRLCRTSDVQEEFADTHHALLSQSIDTIRDRAQAMQDTAAIVPDGLGQDWSVKAVSHAGSEIAGLLRLCFIAISTCNAPPPPNLISQWFKAFGMLGFFSDLTALQSIDEHKFHTIESLSAMVLLSLLTVGDTLNALDIDANAQDLPRTYALDAACVETISTSLASAVDNGNSLAALPLVAWSAIGNLLQVNGFDSGFDGVDRRDSHPLSPSISRSTPVTRAMGQAWRSYVNDLQSGDATAEHFMRAAIQGFDLYSQCADIATQAESSLGHHLFDSVTCGLVRSMSLKCLQEVSRIAAYDGTLIEAIVATIRIDLPWPTFESSPFPKVQSDLVQQLSQSPSLIRLLDEAFARYPFEFQPVLLLCDALLIAGNAGPEIVERVRKVQSFTDRIPEIFAGYEAVREQQYDNCFILRDDLPLFPPSNTQQLSFVNGNQGADAIQYHTEFVVRQGTEGLALSKDHHPVISWRFEHSLVTYVGKWLYEAHKRGLWWPLPNNELNATISDCIRFLHTLVRAALIEEGASSACAILNEAGEALPSHTDIVSLVADVLEDSLGKSSPGDDTDLVLVMSACLAFLAIVLRATPGRVWPLLSRSALVDTSDGASRLMAAIAASERIDTAPGLLSSALELLDALVDDVFNYAIARAMPKETDSKSGRFAEDGLIDPGIPMKQMAHTVSAMMTFTLDFLHDANNWKFDSTHEQAQLVRKAVDAVKRVFRCHDGDDISNAPTDLLSPLRPAADLIKTFFLHSDADKNVSRLLTFMTPLSSQAVQITDSRLISVFVSVARSSAELLTALLEAAETGYAISRQISQCLSEGVPILLRIYAQYRPMQLTIATLLTHIAQAIGRSQQHSISLFASFGADLGHDAVAVMSDLTDLVDDHHLATIRWQLFSACIRNKQTWFSSYLLTGTVPSRTSHTKDNAAAPPGSRHSALGTALDVLSSLSALTAPAAVAALQFVADALNHWPWSINRILEHRHFLSRMSEHLDQLDWTPKSRDPRQNRYLINQTFGASIICEIFAMCFHSTRLIGNIAFTKEWSPRIPLLDQPGFKDPSYQQALHRRFKHNVEKKFPCLHIEDFKRAVDVRGPEDSYYDLECVEELLGSFEKTTQKSLGFLREFQYANDNLCLVAAQKQLIIRWQLLCTELTKDATQDDKLPKKLAYVAHECLEANKESEEAESIFTDLRSLRVDLATAVVQRLVNIRYTSGGIHNLLNAAWDVLRAAKPDFDNAFTGDDKDYYRKCVKLVVLCVRPYTIVNMLTPHQTETQAQQHANAQDKINAMLEIAIEIIAKGFRSLASQLHESPQSVMPADFVLLTSLLQVLLQVKGAENSLLYSQLAIRLSNFNLGRYATALFSWSDRIAFLEQDPVYGEISINFLAEMSVIPSLAETLATEGVLSRLNAANIMTYYHQAGGIGPFQEPLRLHRIWTRGILPLLLNVLIAVGAPIAAEAGTFLNNFAPQLELASNALEGKGTPTSQDVAKGCVTYNAACEAHALSLIASLLDKYRMADDADIPELQWDRAAVKEDVETWVQGTRAYLRERIMPTNEKEVALLRTQPVGNDKDLCEVKSRLEEQVLKELKGAYFVLNTG